MMSSIEEQVAELSAQIERILDDGDAVTVVTLLRKRHELIRQLSQSPAGLSAELTETLAEQDRRWTQRIQAMMADTKTELDRVRTLKKAQKSLTGTYGGTHAGQHFTKKG